MATYESYIATIFEYLDDPTDYYALMFVCREFRAFPLLRAQWQMARASRENS